VRGAALLLLPALALTAGAGCRSGSKTPEAAYARFAKAVTDRDARALYDALDQPTRWAWMTVQKWNREAYDIVISNYPEGPGRERELHRFEKGATASSARELFASETSPDFLASLAKLVVASPRFETQPPGDVAEAVLPDGGRVRFSHTLRSGWGFAGLGPQAEDRKSRAYHDLELVRASAADYERAAARSAR
jgi:hypothetical protein